VLLTSTRRHNHSQREAVPMFKHHTMKTYGD